MKKRWLAGLFLVGVVSIWWLFHSLQERRQRSRPNSAAPKATATSNGQTHAVATSTNTIALSPLDQKLEELKTQAAQSLDRVVKILPVYGALGPDKEREVFLSRRTNRLGGINIEVGIRSGSYYSTFYCGTLDTNGTHINPSLPSGPLFNKLASLYEGTDTRRKPEAMNDWYRSTGKWSESEAIGQTLRLAQALGHQTNRVARTEVVAVPMHVKDPSGAEVVVTPFYKVDLYTTDDSRLLGVEYRVGTEPPGKVTEWFNWPPVRVPR